jgi:hypothetical protein
MYRAYRGAYKGASHTPGHSLAGSVVFCTIFHRFYT